MTIKVLSIRDGIVKLGITAPESVRVDRFEVRRRIERNGYIRPRREPDR